MEHDAINHAMNSNGIIETNKNLKNLMEQAIEDLENCYGRETPLTRAMSGALEDQEKEN